MLGVDDMRDWMIDDECWVLGVNGFYKVHCKSTHHQDLIPNTQHYPYENIQKKVLSKNDKV